MIHYQEKKCGRNMNLKVSQVKSKLKEGGVCFGTILRILKSLQAVTLCASEGWDYIILDTEHNNYDIETLGMFSLVAKYEEIGLFVRVPDKLYHQMAQILDIGAEGLVLPQVKTQEEASHIIRSTKYAPVGQRGVSVSSTTTLFRDYDPLEYLNWANEHLVTIVQIESEEGVENVDEILSIPGIDAVMIGPADLSQDMGIPGQTRHPKMIEAYHKIINSCNRNGVAPGIHLQSIEDVSIWIDKGMRFITYSYDIALFKKASSKALEELRMLI
jgi:2-keto-3-deoxy-L-rhamnonate aldolase RhmA